MEGVLPEYSTACIFCEFCDFFKAPILYDISGGFKE